MRHSVVADAKFGRNCREPRIGGPQTHTSDKRRREQVGIDPANTATMKTTMSDELDHFGMRDCWHVMNETIVGQQLLSTAFVADEKFPEDEVMAADFATTEKFVELTRERRTI